MKYEEIILIILRMICIIGVYIIIRMELLRSRLKDVFDAVFECALKKYPDNYDLAYKELNRLDDEIYQFPTLKAIFCFWSKGYEYMISKEAYKEIEPYLYD